MMSFLILLYVTQYLYAIYSISNFLKQSVFLKLFTVCLHMYTVA